jgi:glycosyltransferase involved in cell wall biosynthesis
MSKKLLYIGNNTSRKTQYGSSILVLSQLLEKENYQVSISSAQQNIFLRMLDMCFTIIKKRKELDFIIIDTFSSLNFYSAFITSQIARVFNIPYIPMLRGGDLPNRLDRSKKLSQMVFLHSHINVAPSNYLKIAFEKKGYQTVLAPNILTIEDYTLKKRTALTPKLLWVRAFKELYNPTLAIDVVDLVKEQFPNAQLTMIGPFKDDSISAVKARIEELKLSDSVEILGVMPKKEWHKKSAEFDIFMNTTNFDNTPNSIIEAMALGLTIVSTNVGGMPYLIEDGVEGRLVDKENPKQMADAIIQILTNNETFFLQNARKKAESFSWEEVRKSWFKILQE